MTSLRGRRLLFIGIGFYDYEAEIVTRVCARGAEVLAFADRPSMLREGWIAGMLNRWGPVARFLARRHEQSMLRQVAAWKPDQVLVIKGVDLSCDFLRTLRAAHPGIDFVLYEWDSLARLPGIEDRLPYFNRVLTFDRPDSLRRKELKFRPLFFRQRADRAGITDGDAIDIAFIGWLHSGRLAAIRNIQAQARAKGLVTFVYIYTGILTWLRLWLRGDAGDVHIRPIPYDTIVAVNRRTRCVLDLPHHAQGGLTMRAVEAIGFGTKLLTTAVDVAHYDFYSPDNVQIVAADRLELDSEFILSPMRPLAEATRNYYSLDTWLTEVLEPAEDLRAGRVAVS